MDNKIERKNYIFKLITLFLPLVFIRQTGVLDDDVLTIYLIIVYFGLFFLDINYNNTFKEKRKNELLLLLIYVFSFAFCLLLIFG
ncbi:MAG: hypothetical protein KKH01_03660 [Firmicutes bacterium]|nr:hypothetical protein [Bacillota bacterium]